MGVAIMAVGRGLCSCQSRWPRTSNQSQHFCLGPVLMCDKGLHKPTKKDLNPHFCHISLIFQDSFKSNLNLQTNLFVHYENQTFFNLSQFH